MYRGRTFNRERVYVCGDYLDGDIYPVFQKPGERRKRCRPTSEIQKKLNQRNAAKRLTRIVHMNFTSRDLALHLTYDPTHTPESAEDALRIVQNYLRTLGLSHDMLHVVARVDDPEAIKQMVSGGVGLAVLSALAVEQEVQNGTLLAFEMDKSALKRTIYLITLKSQQLSRMEQKLVDFLKSPHRRKRVEAQN